MNAFAFLDDNGVIATFNNYKFKIILSFEEGGISIFHRVYNLALHG
jgi:hypothetical protein